MIAAAMALSSVTVELSLLAEPHPGTHWRFGIHYRE